MEVLQPEAPDATELPPLLASLLASAASFHSVSTVHNVLVSSMQSRAARAASRLQKECARLFAIVDRFRADRVTAALRTWNQVAIKGFDERVEEADGDSRILDALAALCRACQPLPALLTELFAAGLEHLPLQFMTSSPRA